jgi:syntaxin 6
MLDDFAHEMDTTETKMDNVMKKIAKVLHMSNGLINALPSTNTS